MATTYTTNLGLIVNEYQDDGSSSVTNHNTNLATIDNFFKGIITLGGEVVVNNGEVVYRLDGGI